MQESTNIFDQPTFQTAITNNLFLQFPGSSTGLYSQLRLASSSSLIIDGTSNNDMLRGGSGNETLRGFNSQDELFGGAGDDELDGGDGDDKLFGEQGRDTLLGVSGQDILLGGLGNDILDGGDGDDRLFGDDGNDALFGGQGQDQLLGGVGFDILNGGQGDNTMTGGSGRDIFTISRTGKNRITDFEPGVDLLSFEGDLSFETIRIFEQNGETWITTLDNQPLAFLTGIRPSSISRDPFLNLPVDPDTGIEYRPNELLVRFKPGVTQDLVQSIALNYGAIAVERLVPSSSSVDRWQVLRFAPETNLLQIRYDLSRDINVEIAGFDYKLVLNAIPNDPDFGELWGLNNTGQSGGTDDADIDAPEAWDIQTGNSSVIVAVTDTGIDYNHPDLRNNIWRNTEESFNGIDDDGNGYVDDIRGYDFSNGDSNPMDVDGHGTHVAGTIGAEGDNSEGVVGVSQNVSLMALKIFNDNGDAFLRDSVRGIDYATTMGARIINASWSNSRTFWREVGSEIGEFFGIESSFAAVTDTIRRANDAQVLFVAAAGNDGANLDTFPLFPANLDLPNVITVANTDRNDELALKTDNLTLSSNFGRATVDLGAPGRRIYSTVPGGGYDYKSGTSMAAPHVAGAAALLLAQFPSLAATELRDILMNTTDKIPSLDGKTVSGGRLNVNQALLSLNPEKRVELTITRVREIDSIEPDFIFGDDPEFYAVAEISGEEFPRTTQVTGSTIRPNWRFFKSVTETRIPIKIQIFDDDGFGRSNDDHVDINPSKGEKDLYLTFDLDTRELVDSDTGEVFEPLNNGEFRIRGQGDSSRGEIRFTLNSFSP
jgi:subtilisin family serine protease